MNPYDSWSSRTDPHASDQPAMTCICMGEDAHVAYHHIRASETTETFAEESHFMVTIKRCALCGQSFLSLFTELVDLTDGDDSQAWMYVPITHVHAALLRSAREVDDHAIQKLRLSGRHLARVYPRGGESRISWTHGPLVILPHD